MTAKKYMSTKLRKKLRNNNLIQAGTNQPTNKVFVYNFANGIEEEVQPATSLTDK